MQPAKLEQLYSDYFGPSARLKFCQGELLENLEELIAEDIDLDDALVALRGLQGDHIVPSPGRNLKLRFNHDSTGEQQQVEVVATCDFQGRDAVEVSRDSVSSATRMSTCLNLGINGTSTSALGGSPEAVPSASTVAPFNVLEAEQALRAFDCSTRWGPALSLTRFDRLARRRMHPGAPTGWEWVDDILRRFSA